MTAVRSVLFAAKQTVRFQMPPHIRTGADEVLLVMVPSSEDGKEPTWRFPRVGEVEHSGDPEPLTDATELVRLDARFELPGGPSRDYFWCNLDFARDVSPTVYDPAVPLAINRFARNQKLDRILAHADSTFTPGDFPMSPTIQHLQRELDDLKRQLGPAGDRKEFTAAQARADAAYRLFGTEAPLPLGGERIMQYRARLATGVKQHSPKWSRASLDGLNDSILAEIEGEIYADAVRTATHPTGFRPGEVRAIVTMDAANRPITRYIGDPNAIWDQFNPGVRYVRRFNAPGRAA